MANILLALCILAGPVALGIVVAVYGFQLPVRRGLFPRVAPPPPWPAVSAVTSAPSREFAVEPTVVVNADLDAVVPSAVHRPSRPELPVAPLPLAAAPPVAARAPSAIEPTTEQAASPLITQTTPTVAEPRPLLPRRAPPPLPRHAGPRARVARGSVVPPLPHARPDTTTSTASAFDDCTDVDDVTRTDAPPWHAGTPARFAN